MIDPIEVLMEEHRVIEKGLDALDAFSKRVESKEIQEGAQTLGQLVEFIQEFADRTHHGKEEDILFDEMVKNGFSKESGPIAVMLSEHDEGRSYVRGLKEYSQKAEAWTEDDRKKIRFLASSFVTLLRQHIQKEDQILYPMAQSRLSSEVMQTIAERCEKFQEEQTQKKEDNRLRDLLRTISG